MLKQAVMTQAKVLPWHQPGETGKSHEIPVRVVDAPCPTFEIATRRIRLRRVTAPADLLGPNIGAMICYSLRLCGTVYQLDTWRLYGKSDG